MLQAGKWGIHCSTKSKTRKSQATQLSDDEIRRRIIGGQHTPWKSFIELTSL